MEDVLNNLKSVVNQTVDKVFLELQSAREHIATLQDEVDVLRRRENELKKRKATLKKEVAKKQAVINQLYKHIERSSLLNAIHNETVITKLEELLQPLGESVPAQDQQKTLHEPGTSTGAKQESSTNKRKPFPEGEEKPSPETKKVKKEPKQESRD